MDNRINWPTFHTLYNFYIDYLAVKVEIDNSEGRGRAPPPRFCTLTASLIVNFRLMRTLIVTKTSSGRIQPSSIAYLGWRTCWEGLVQERPASITRNCLLNQVRGSTLTAIKYQIKCKGLCYTSKFQTFQSKLVRLA